MNVVETPHTNTQVAKNQEEYKTMPSTVLPDGHVISCWELTDEEVQQVVENRRIYLHQQTFNKPVQPVMIRSWQMLDLFYPYKQRFADTSLAVCIASLIGKNAPETCFEMRDRMFLEDNEIDNLAAFFAHICHTVEQIGNQEPGKVYIAGGADPRDPEALHFVLVLDNAVIHDPHPSNLGINSVEVLYQLTKDQ